MRQTVPQSNRSDKGEARHSLSSAAYFPASTTDAKRQEIISNAAPGMRSWVALKLANRVQRGEAAEQQYRIDVHADMIKVSRPRPLTGLPEYPQQGGGKRGAVKGFSRASRKRMFEFMATVRNTGYMMFLTLTYDDMAWLCHWGTHQDHFEAFRKRFQRAFPTFSAIWRVELQTRKSGILIGNDVPHFHLIIFTNCEVKDEWQKKLAQMFQSWGSEAWHEIIASENEDNLVYGFHVEPVRSRKHAYHYVSKYVGKHENDSHEIGRRWGRIGTFDCAASETIRMDEEEIIILRRLIKRWLRNRNKGFARRYAKGNKLNGFTIFGLGDTTSEGEKKPFCGGISQFVVETRRQKIERNSCHEFWGY